MYKRQEQEERGEHRQQDAGEHLDDDGDAFQPGRGDRLGVVTDRVLEVLGDLVDLTLGHMEGALEQPALQLGDALLDLTGHRVDVVLNLPDNEPADQAHHHEAADEGQRGGQPACQSAVTQPGHGGLEHRGDQQRGDEGEDDQLDGGDDLRQHPQPQQPPARLGGDPYAPRHRRDRVRAGGDGGRIGGRGGNGFGRRGGGDRPGSVRRGRMRHAVDDRRRFGRTGGRRREAVGRILRTPQVILVGGRGLRGLRPAALFLQPLREPRQTGAGAADPLRQSGHVASLPLPDATSVGTTLPVPGRAG